VCRAATCHQAAYQTLKHTHTQRDINTYMRRFGLQIQRSQFPGYSQEIYAFCALTLLAGHQEEHMARKNGVMRCWYGYLSAVRCRLLAYSPADSTASQSPSSLASFKSRLTQVVVEKRPLNRLQTGCSMRYLDIFLRLCW